MFIVETLGSVEANFLNSDIKCQIQQRSFFSARFQVQRHAFDAKFDLARVGQNRRWKTSLAVAWFFQSPNYCAPHYFFNRSAAAAAPPIILLPFALFKWYLIFRGITFIFSNLHFVQFGIVGRSDPALFPSCRRFLRFFPLYRERESFKSVGISYLHIVKLSGKSSCCLPGIGCKDERNGKEDGNLRLAFCLHAYLVIKASWELLESPSFFFVIA